MIVPDHSALQHEHAPRPLPLFLELVREVATTEPELARDALKGLALYSAAPRPGRPPERPEIASAGPASLRDHGGTGPPLVLIPSLINPPHVLDLDEEVSLSRAVAEMGCRSLLFDWGKATERAGLSIAGHVEDLLVPLLAKLSEPAILVGYCLGGTMAIAAANLAPVKGLVTLACPWRFSQYPDDSRAALGRLWRDSRTTSEALGVMPIEVLQASFWSLDPHRTVAKFSELSTIDPQGPEFRRFLALEDWANEGDPLPLPAARELLEDFFGSDLTGAGKWTVGGQPIETELTCRQLHFTAAKDRITPAAAAPPGPQSELPTGHVGMVVGRARKMLHRQLSDFVSACR